MKLIIGRKLNMSQVYGDNGAVVPVTEIRAGAGKVVQVKDLKKDGYCAVQFGFSEGSKNVSKSVEGHVKGIVKNPKLIEMRVEDTSSFKTGQAIDIGIFEKGEKVSVSGLSKGRGFQGVVKRHGFHGSNKTHGTKHHLRAPGSIGATDPQRVFPGMKMAGRMGNTKVTVKNLEIVDVDKKNGIIKIKGAIPGPRGGLVKIISEGEIKFASEPSGRENEKTEFSTSADLSAGVKIRNN